MGMELIHRDIVDIDLDTGTVFRSFANKMIVYADKEANLFGFRCLRNGTPVTLTGLTVVGYFIRADGGTIIINEGSANGDTAYVTIPETCYAYEGNFSLAIKLTDGGDFGGTMRIVDGTVVHKNSGVIIDPGTVVPDLEELLAIIGDAEAAADAIAEYSVVAELISGNNYRIKVSVPE